jgi:hypothetical protein
MIPWEADEMSIEALTMGPSIAVRSEVLIYLCRPHPVPLSVPSANSDPVVWGRFAPTLAVAWFTTTKQRLG